MNLGAEKLKHRATAIRWGFIWALWTAVLWGAWYIPGSDVWREIPYVSQDPNNTSLFLTSAAIISTFNAVFVLCWLFVWLGVLEKWQEYVRTIKKFRYISKWYFLAAIFGGPMAIFGSFMAMGYVGPIYAAVAALMYPVVGSFLAHVWYKEKITQRAVIGIILILVGGVVIVGPGISKEIMAGASGAAWLGYLGGLMAAVGWGVEGAIAGRALDITDPDVGITIRFTAETIYWVILILPISAILFHAPVLPIVRETFNFWPILMLVLAGITFGFCYVSWYKSFPLIGVGRGQAIGDLYGMFAIIFVTIFTWKFPEWYFIVGCILTILGGFVMYTEKRDVLEVIRTLPEDGSGKSLGGA